ncbi:Metabotropic glutamate receptor [Portunus trituberculatus]|uniref:Metabotropic glutamate receptor n=1 Tax=Portunus trituberculatus TaxID=210409 RepID=A0A5B7E9Y2_PORTR|nr:Metabotropic glutamate receptor [Portunus trituberculatus]
MITNKDDELTGADCSVAVNGATLQEVEAFLWAVDQINQHAQLLPSTTLGALVLDTCGSRIRTMNQVTSLVKSSLPGININLDDVRALVTSLDPETARVAGEMLSSLNVTSINMGPSQAHSPYTLQMSPPINMEAEAMVQVGD